jgi:FkbM family methyltransferase
MPEYLDLKPEIIVWIEADANHLDEIRGAIESHANNITHQTCVQSLISDEDGKKLDFRIYNNEGQSSSIFPVAAAHSEQWPSVEETGEILSLSARRLDTLLPERGVRPEQVDVLIFDIQGSELLAMKGAGAFLEACRYVEVEVSTKPAYEGAPLAHEIDAYLVARGFNRLTPVLTWHSDAVYGREPKPTSLVEFHLDVLEPRQLAGWAYDELSDEVSFHAVVNGKPVLDVVANEYRADLHTAKIGSGKYGFTAALAEPLKRGDRIEVVDARSGATLHRAEF